MSAAEPETSTTDRLRLLEDERSIEHTLETYGYAVDYGLEDEYRDCWLHDAVLELPTQDAPMRGLEEILDAFRAHTHAPEAYHKHLLFHPRIQIDQDTATVESHYARLDDGPEGAHIRSFGRYLDVLVRCHDGRWRFRERRAIVESTPRRRTRAPGAGRY